MRPSPEIAFFPEASFGAALNCVGIAQELQKLGATPVFICHPGFTGVFAEYGFKEFHLPESPSSSDESIADYWQDFTNTHVPHFNLDPLAQLDTYVEPTWKAIVDTAIAVEDDLARLLAQIRPDAVVLDNVIMFPAIARAGCPWIRIVSCAETEIPDPAVPPYLSGLAPENKAEAAAYSEAYETVTAAVHRRYNSFRKKQGLPPLPAPLFLENSPVLNLLLAPSVVRYERKTPLPEDRFVFLEGCVRHESHFEMPRLPVSDGPLVYVGFGSLGAVDTGMMKRMIDVFEGIQARFLVNVGAMSEAYERVPDNVHLGSWFPQPSVIEQADLVIHHGGNNTFCEALFHGVPSLVLPYCWDGHDNAQRAETVEVGRHINRANWTADSLRSAIIETLTDTAMRQKLKKVSGKMQQNRGTEQAARKILGALNGNSIAP
ncbi:glycosyltransferase [Neptunicoccus cionae]|uniref:glycosyltransferase n=1 Tax=Neptunicoccus cionae TaxID=2035344 RepID=UPI000C76073F|nr:glycosyltransferase [Amylibacter cionae]PLS21193.1 glycosyl transferase family 1 [Amylibacter cionae]